MRSVSAAFEAAIALGTVKICEIYDLELANGTVYRYTDHSKDITWNAGGDTYTSVGIERGPIRFNSDGQTDECEINLGNISGDLYDKVLNNILEAAKITIKRIRWDANYAADEEIQLFVGVPDVGFDNSVLTLNIKSIFSSLNINVPAHMFQPSCNYALFDDNCGLTRADYAYSGTATGGSRTTLVDTTRGTLYAVDFDAGDSANPIERGDTVTGQTGAGTGVVVQIVYLTVATGTLWYVEQSGVQFVDDEELQNAGADSIVCNGTPAEDTEFFIEGEVEITSGDNNGACRPVQSNSANTVTFKWPFVAAIANGDTYKVYPGCDGRAAEVCEARFNNDSEWDGYPYVPRIEEVML